MKIREPIDVSKRPGFYKRMSSEDKRKAAELENMLLIRWMPTWIPDTDFIEFKKDSITMVKWISFSVSILAMLPILSKPFRLAVYMAARKIKNMSSEYLEEFTA